jgi:DNA-directed RNA polymerase II subunit RPB3
MPVRYIDDKGNEENPILIMKLSRNQKLDFTLIAKKGTAKTHAKWSPVATCMLRAEPIIELDQTKIQKLTAEHKQELVARCPRKVFTYNQMRESVDIENADKCNLCNECARYISEDLDLSKNEEYKDVSENWDRMIRVDESENKFQYTVESTGALSPEDIVLKAFIVLRKKLQIMRESL